MKEIFYKKNEEVDKCNVHLLENDNGSVKLKIEFEKDAFHLEENGDNYFQVLCELRKKLNNQKVELLCNGTSLNVYPSAMQLGMGGGDRAYRLKMGCHTQMTDIVETFEYDKENHKISTLEEQSEFHEKWILSKKKLEVRKPKYTTDNILNNNNKAIYFWGHQPSKSGSIGKSCLSQWWSCDFIDNNGNKYSSTEQWMMAEKARVFSDPAILEDILNTDNPKQVKVLGRKVSFFDNEVWSKRAYDIVVEGNLLKFGQNKVLKDYLLSTEDATIVEASPYDKIWGIGMKQDDEGIEDPKNWKGENLLGFALMEVRDILNQVNQLA